MEKIICPYCEKDLADDTGKLADEKYNYSIVKSHTAGSIILPEGVMFYTLITCPNPDCNKILGAINSSHIPVSKYAIGEK